MPQVGENVGFPFLLGGGEPRQTVDVLLEIVVQVLIRIEIGCVRRRVENGYFVGVFRNPRLHAIRNRYADFLKGRNELGQFKHRTLRSAVRSLRSNLPFLFTYKRFPHLMVPATTNSCDGSFAHWKNTVKIHRGFRPARRSKMIAFLLADS